MKRLGTYLYVKNFYQQNKLKLQRKKNIRKIIFILVQVDGNRNILIIWRYSKIVLKQSKTLTIIKIFYTQSVRIYVRYYVKILVKFCFKRHFLWAKTHIHKDPSPPGLAATVRTCVWFT